MFEQVQFTNRGAHVPAPSYTINGAATTGTIAYEGSNHWLIAYTDTNAAVQVRELNTASRTLSQPINMTPALVTNAAAGPAIAYLSGRFVLVWPQARGNQAFRYAVLAYTRGTGFATVQATGDIPMSGGYVSESQSSPSLTHDGNSTFYLAAIHRSGLTGLTYDALHVYSSADGQSWTPLTGLQSFLSFKTALTHASIAARGETVVTFVESDGVPHIYRRSGTVWSEDANALGKVADEDISITRWRR